MQVTRNDHERQPKQPVPEAATVASPPLTPTEFFETRRDADLAKKPERAEEAGFLSAVIHKGAPGDVGHLAAEDFEDLRHRLIFEQILALTADAVAITVPALAARLEQADTLGSPGGWHAFLAHLADYEGTAAFIRGRAAVVRRQGLKRRLKAICARVVEDRGTWGDLRLLISIAKELLEGART